MTLTILRQYQHLTSSGRKDKQWNVIRLTDKIMMSSGSTIQQFASDLIDAREQGKTVLVDCGDLTQR